MTITLVLAASLPFVTLLLIRPAVRRMVTRGMSRRPVELLLVVVGSMLATAILTGSLLVGDTVDRSIRSQAYDQLGPIDEVVSVSGLDAGDRLRAALDGFTSDDVDGMLPMITAPVAAVGAGADPLVQPTAQLVEVDFAAAAAFGGDPDATGITGGTPAPGRAAITADLADKVRIGPGDTIAVFAYGASLELTVDRVLPRTGVAGFWLGRGQRSYNVFVAPGAVAELSAGPAAAEAEAPTALVAVSNRGGVEAGAEATDVVSGQLEAALGDLEAAVRPVKDKTLETAEALGASLGDLYFTVGMFAVAAGVLLLVNIFVMLADERRHELGMMRAIGLRRSPMVAQFATEGWLYALVSSAVGAVVGIGVGWVIAWRSAQILSSGREVDALRIEFSVDPASVVGGLAIGFLISLATILATSARIARLNVIGAIRDLPAMATRRHRRRWAVAGAFLAAVGVLWTVGAATGRDAYGILLGPVLAMTGLAPLALRRWSATAVATVAGSASLAWAIVAIPILGSLDVDFDIPLFLAQGLTLVGAAVAVVTVHQARIGRALSRLTGGSLSVRLGLAYPLARTFRTAMTLGMVAIVVLTLTYISVMSAMFNGQSDKMTADASGGFEIVVQSNPSNPVAAGDLAAVDGVDGIAPLAYAAADFVLDDDEPVTWPVTGFDDALLVAPPALDELGGYETAEAAWQAVLSDPDLIIVDEFFLVTDAGPPADTVEVGDEVTIVDPLSGNERTLTVAAMAKADWIGNGVFYSRAGLDGLFAEPPAASRAFVSATVPDAVVEQLRTTFVANGIEADTIRDRVETALALNTAFFTLMEQFVGAGLVIGTAGIGVIMVRAVRERRREIGVLRALGFPTASVARAFVVEACFVSVEGVVVGMVTAIIASYGLASSTASWAENLEWTLPVGALAVIAAITIVASLLASLWPARSAARIRPAVALRLAD